MEDKRTAPWTRDETRARAELRALQLARLREVVQRVASVPFYREAFCAASITPESIRSLDDLRRLPLTTKDDLRKHYPFGFFTVPREKLARIHCSSGTTGLPTVVGYTAEDLETWAGLCARFLVAGGLRAEHVVHIAFGYGMFTGGFGLHQCQEVGAAIVPAHFGNTPRHTCFLRDFKPDAAGRHPFIRLQIMKWPVLRASTR